MGMKFSQKLSLLAAGVLNSPLSTLHSFAEELRVESGEFRVQKTTSTKNLKLRCIQPNVIKSKSVCVNLWLKTFLLIQL